MSDRRGLDVPWIATLADVVDAVAALPATMQVELALGALPDGEGCRACNVLGPHVTAPVDDTPVNRLQFWHEELCRHRPGHGPEQDATRAGAIYGVAAALSLPAPFPVPVSSGLGSDQRRKR